MNHGTGAPFLSRQYAKGNPMYKFELKQVVRITASSETGEVIARVEYANTPEGQYLLRYKAADGRAVEAWWGEGALVAASA